MAILPNGYDPKTLQDVINQSTGAQTANLTDSYQQQRKRDVADQASGGRLMSGVSSYPLTDLDTRYQQGLSGIQTGAANEMAGIPAEDWLNQQQFGRQLSLAQQIANQMKPSTLEQVFGGIGAAGSLAGLGVGIAGLA
jgi:hypothetical protein